MIFGPCTNALDQVPINDHSLPQTYAIPGPPVFTGTATKKAREFTA